jgi:Ethanolamine utilization protein EutJ (predicted chaperonin)
MEDLVGKYISLRDAKAKIVAKQKEEVAKIDSVLDQIEAALLVSFQELGTESIRTKEGTAYKQVRTSATVADWDVLLAYIRKHELWQMLERRVSKDAVREFREANGEIPPGVNTREEIVINVRRS